MNDREIRAFGGEFRVSRTDDGSSLRGHAAVFNSLSENLGGFREQIKPGAFKWALENDDVRALINHDSNLVIGRNTAGTLRMKEDKTGLAVEIDLPDTQAARDLSVSIERGDISQMSFGFRVRAGGQEWGEDDDGDVIRTLTDLSLFDVSPVAYPAYPATDVGLRSLETFQTDKANRKAIFLRILDAQKRRLQLSRGSRGLFY